MSAAGRLMGRATKPHAIAWTSPAGGSLSATAETNGPAEAATSPSQTHHNHPTTEGAKDMRTDTIAAGAATSSAVEKKLRGAIGDGFDLACEAADHARVAFAIGSHLVEEGHDADGQITLHKDQTDMLMFVLGNTLEAIQGVRSHLMEATR